MTIGIVTAAVRTMTSGVVTAEVVARAKEVPMSSWRAPLERNTAWEEQSMTAATSIALPAGQEGTVMSIRPVRGSSSVKVTLNCRFMVVAPTGVSEYFAGIRVRASGVWRQGAGRRYLLASEVEPLESPADLGPERLGRVPLSVPSPSGEHLEVLHLLAPALTWLLSSGSPALACKLAHLSVRKARQIAHNPYVLVRRRDLDNAYL